jgi:hypothetical protein
VLARTRAVVAATVGLPLLLAACGQPARPGNITVPVTMAWCGSGPQVRPATVEIVCGTSDISAGSLTWSAWGKQIATAVGTAVVDLCTYEDCHEGSYSSVPIVVIASKIARCGRDGQAYARLQYVFVGGSPFPTVPPDVKFSDHLTGAPRPRPPADQTVSLTCS